ncbi:MAG: TIGR03960 family B12-binding radical SAM protein [Candidatus Aminicenantes bacterium]|nr:TIGR03960 family B12-binding radical SAM protein [Candidatus Aminicenantes bacterium]
MSKLEKLFKSVQKPGRYLGEEWNVIKKDPEEVKLKIALVFPDTYEVGMSYLGQKILYWVLNKHPDILAERVYAPWPDFESALRKERIPLYSLESKIPLYDFDILGFSLLYELNYSNILTILDLGHIPLLSGQRDSRSPLIIAGGPAASNPEPVSDFFDLFVIGDGEQVFIKLAENYLQRKKESQSKSSILKALAQIKGVYVPVFYRTHQLPGSKLLVREPAGNVPSKVKKNVLLEFDSKHLPSEPIVPNISPIFDRISVETTRGCAQNCRFCQARNIYFPVRNKDPGMVMEEMIGNLNSTGYEEASLSALSVGDYPDLEATIDFLMTKLSTKNISLSLSALRPKFLTDEMAENITKVKKTGLTIVPEAGTERLRKVINKKLKEQEIFDAMSAAFSKGWRKIKMYFMVGLPTEREEDLQGIVDLIERIIRLGYQIMNKPPQINLSVSSFIPKPHTPFQWVKMNTMKELKYKHEFLRKKMNKYGFVWLKEHSVENAVLEGIFSRGDQRLNPVLLRAWTEGARFDGWTDQFDFSIWKKSFDKENLDPQDYLSSLSQSSVLPWDHIDIGVKKSYLKKELKEAFKEKWTESCESRDCQSCRGCSFPGNQNRIGLSRIPPVSLSENRCFQKADKENRYRFFYSKQGPAKYLSHKDLSQIIPRSFRRAGIQVRYSQGFHPKMHLSFPPALGLGMEGREEVLEFRSHYQFPNKRFVKQANHFFPKGIRALRIEKISADRPSLSKDINGVCYSLDLNKESVQAAFKKKTHLKKVAPGEALEFLKKVINQNGQEHLKAMELDEKKQKIWFEFLFSPSRGIGLKPMFKTLLGIEYPNFALTREKFIFKS